MDLSISGGWLPAVSGARRRELKQSGLEQHLCELAAIVEQCDDLVCVTDRDGSIEYVNPAFERATGYARDEVIGETPSLLKSGAHDAAFYTALWDTLLAGHPFQARFVNRRKDGARFFEDKTITPVHDRDGEITHFVCTGRDITAEVRAAERLTRAQRALAVIRECRRAVLDLADDDALHARLCRAMVERGGYRAAWIGLAGRAEQCAAWGADLRGPEAAAIRAACSSAAGSPGVEGETDWHDLARRYGVIAVPLPGERGTLGALLLAAVEPGTPREDELALLGELAGQIGFDLEALRRRRAAPRA
jgi:PAS domain S-box-containing protein